MSNYLIYIPFLVYSIIVGISVSVIIVRWVICGTDFIQLKYTEKRTNRNCAL